MLNFLRLLKTEKNLITHALIYGIFISLLSLAVPLSVQFLINSVAFTALLQPIIVLGLILLILLFSWAALNTIQFWAMEVFQQKFFARYALKIAAFENKQNASRFFEIITVQKTIPKFITKSFAVILQGFLGLVLIAFYHPFFLIFSFFVALSLYSVCRFYFNEAAKSAALECSKKHEIANAILQNEPFSKTENLAKEYLKQRKHHFSYLFKQNILLLLLYVFFSVVLLILGGFLVLKSQLTLGQLVASEIVLSSVLYAFSRLALDLESFYDLLAALEKLSIFENVKNEKNNLLSEIDLSEKLKKLPKKLLYFLLVIILFLSVTPWQQTAKGLGQVIASDPNNRAQAINATISGRISKWYVKDGSKVKKGDKIVEIIDNDPLILERVRSERDAKKRKWEVAEMASRTAKIDYERQEELYKKGLSSKKTFESAKIEYKKLLGATESANAELAEAEVKLSRQESQLILAPRDGTILKVLAGDNSTIVKSGDKIASFAPQIDEMAVELYVSGNDIPLIYEGRKVRLQFEGWPVVQFRGWPSVSIGTFAGTVSAVDSSISENGKFRVIVKKPENEEWPNEMFLRHGSKVHGFVLLNSVLLGYELWRQANAFPPSFDEVLKNEKK